MTSFDDTATGLCDLSVAMETSIPNETENVDDVKHEPYNRFSPNTPKGYERKSLTKSTKSSKKAQISIPPTAGLEGNDKLVDPEIGCKCDLVTFVKGNENDKERLEKEYTKDCKCGSCSSVIDARTKGMVEEEVEGENLPQRGVLNAGVVAKT